MVNRLIKTAGFVGKKNIISEIKAADLNQLNPG
jgi:hypothetical protein